MNAPSEIQGLEGFSRKRPTGIHGRAETAERRVGSGNGRVSRAIVLTNNLSEQVIREHELMRKIIDTFRSDDAAEHYQYIASVFATWRLQEKDVFGELKKLLVNELCLR